jgi:hypothetical protein
MRHALLIAAFIFASPVHAQLERPAGWRVRTDGGPTDTIYHVRMPPGWHVTTGPGSIVYDPAVTLSGRFAVSMDVHLFPKPSAEGYGLFLGGSNLEDGNQSWVGFLMRHDGAVSVVHRAGRQTHTLAGWTPGDAVKPHPGTDDTVLNQFVVRAELDSVRVEANGKRVLALPRASLPVDGVAGFRVGAGLNLHITNLDVTRRHAPVPAPKR